MELEAACGQGPHEPYPFALVHPSAPTALDWQPMVEAILADVAGEVPAGVIAGRFHASLARMIVDVAVRVGESRVVLTGGCFQNRRLLERAVVGLRDAGLRPYWHQRVPPNDGGISLGQIAAATRSRTLR
jgi:hydrogenase maturation protein HypF